MVQPLIEEYGFYQLRIMNLENIKSTTTWAEASGTMNNNNAKISEAIERLESAVEEGGSGGTADSVAWNKVTGKPSWITDSKPVYAKEDLSQGVQTSLDKADTALQAIPDGYATEEYTREQVRHILNLMSTALEGKVDKVDGKQLSTEDFTTALKEKLESLSSSGGGGVDSEALQALSDRLDLIVSGGTSGVIDSFIDMISFLTGINDSVKLKDMLDTLRESILRKQNTIEDLDAIRSGAALGATAVQQDALSGYLPLTGGNIEGDVRIMNQSGVLILVNTANGERAAFSYRGESGWYVSNNNWAVDYKLWHEGNFNPLTYKAPSAANADNADTLDGMHGYSYFRSLGGFGDNTDFNNVIESGVYINTVGNYTNYQNEPFSHGYLLVFNTGNGYAKSLQIATPHSGSEIKVRQFWADSWTPWKSLAFTDGNVASADNATTAQLSDKSILLQGVESDDFSGTDLELNMKLFSGVSAGAEGLFPYGSNANAVLTVNKHRGNYNSQLGFSSNGLLYYRNGSNEVLTTQPWKRIAFTDTKVDASAKTDKIETTEWIVGSHSSAPFVIRSLTYGGNVITCDHEGKVGVGTTNLTHTLTVNGEASFRNVRILNQGVDSWLRFSAYNDDNGISFGLNGCYRNQGFVIYNYGISSAALMISKDTNNVGIGTTDNKEITHKLTVNGTASISGDTTIGGTTTLRDVRMSDAIAIRMGVGTTISEDYALSVGGDVSVSGYVMTEGVSMYSQRSLKDVVDEEGLSLEELATIKPTRFTWKDGRDEKVHIGGIADDVQKVLPEAVRETPEGILTMDYPVASFAVASSLVKPVTDHEERIAELERDNKQLREELEMIKRYIGYGNDK